MVKILTIAAMILLTAAVFVNAKPQENGNPDGERMVGNGEFAEKILDDIRAKDPNEAARLEQLREENPRQFRMELRKIAMKDMPMGEPDMRLDRKGRGGEMRMPGGQDGMPGMMPGGRGGMPGMATERAHMMEGQLMTWLKKNEPAEANSLAALKGKDPQAYMRKIMIDARKYRQIMDVEETNPALAEVLKKELKLKEHRNELLEKFRATEDAKQKETIKAELKDVLSQTFDVSLQKQQIKYEELKKRLEELQKNVNKSQTELENFKNNKDALVDKELENIISPSGQFNWD